MDYLGMIWSPTGGELNNSHEQRTMQEMYTVKEITGDGLEPEIKLSKIAVIHHLPTNGGHALPLHCNKTKEISFSIDI